VLYVRDDEINSNAQGFAHQREHMDRNIREVEAGSIALICCESLGLLGAEAARGYIQHWPQGKRGIPNQSAARIFSAAQTILKAGSSREESQ
jgi:hypothetical protein